MALYEDESRRELWMDYVAVCTSTAAKMSARLSGMSFDIPLWTEIAHPETKTKDTRSAAEIRDDVLAKLKGESA